MELTMLVRKGAQQFADRPAVICGDGVQTYGRLHERACRFAGALGALGVTPGERVMTLSDNGAETIEHMVGIALGGFVRSAAYTHNSPESNLYLLNLVEAVCLVVQRRHYDGIAPLLADCPSLRHVIVFDGEAPEGTTDYETALAAAAPVDPGTAPDRDAAHVVRFSAGTTGKPKGVLHTSARWTAVGNEMALVMPRLTPDDRYLAAGPLSHAAMLPMWPVLAAGGAVVVMPAFHPERFLDLLEEHRCTVTFLVPTMIQMIVRTPGVHDRDVSSLRVLIYGAAPISEQTLAEADAVWGPVMYQMYGQSEGVPLTVLRPEDHVADPADPRHRLLRSAGRPTPSSEITIVDEAGATLPVGEVGEIAARSPTVMEGIWRDADATAQRLLPDGRLLTRDMGYLDADGYLFLADRKEDLIISGGFNIWPAELENALASHPAVAEAAVVGVAHEKWGETPHAAVVLRDGHSATETELVDWTRERLGAVKRVTAVAFVDELPKTPIGKVLRRVVREQLLAGDPQPVAGA
ncbi:AMP-binding protein [Paraconexibacter antarcticus]|uniref:AMP-binding protein n=1 Tax=Paraconexibacter antarcticus TaxID=2949664 RepID=A0ABY5DXD1_9ACTN|nr:AMP-binding protein [Paraconexibacter antarcticus]UTI66696.1 AMP-binding protein [Paraconexibacter antarcticus]